MALQAAALARDWYYSFHRYLLEQSEFEPLRQVFPFELEKFRDFNFCHEAHYNGIGLVHGALNQALNDLLGSAFNCFVREGLGILPLAQDATSNEAALLDQQGYCHLPSHPAALTQKIIKHFEDCRLHVMQQDGTWLPVSDEEARTHNVARYERPDILACPEILSVITQKDVLAIVEQHLGVTPTLINLSCWRSHAGLKGPEKAQFHHFDLDDYRFCKLFVYLSDAGEEAGPHVYVPGSHRSDKILEARDRWPEGPQAFMEWYLKSVRKSDEDVEKGFDTSGIRLKGRQGDSFITNTAGIHKGEFPKSKDRFLLQMEFSATPMLTELIDPVPWADQNYSLEVKEKLVDPTIAYVTRLFLS